MRAIRIARVEAFAFRVPIANPIRLAFGTFLDRPFVLVRVVDVDGAEGWGEAWCNWPTVGAEHRARLAADFGERLIGREWQDPPAAFRALSTELEVLVLQTGEDGPIAQALAALDIALWDLSARRMGVPLCRTLDAAPRSSVPVYATGINPDGPEIFAAALQAEGHRAFKLKIGFGHELDVRNLRAMRAALGDDAAIAADANQALTLDAARDLGRDVAPLGLLWLEEPLRVDAPQEAWHTLADTTPVPLAGGENLRGAALEAAATGAVFRALQPDITKWGGFSGTMPIARETVRRGKLFCPHVFGGGIALLAGLHALAAVGGDGLLEFDCHPNAGRELVVGDALPVRDGTVTVPQGPGLGVVPDLGALGPYRTWPPR